MLAHPGFAVTGIGRGIPNPVVRVLLRLGGMLAAQSAAMGALDQLYAATAPEAEGGTLIGPSGAGERKGHPAVVGLSESAQDPDLARRLWEVSEELTGVGFP